MLRLMTVAILTTTVIGIGVAFANDEPEYQEGL
jgi:hypothetical protein